jgi:dTDP-4-amino-4,6-dideoxygalactose transaminase
MGSDMSEASIPFLDLITPHKGLKDEILSVVSCALDMAGFIGGPMVKAFENEFAEYCEVKDCVGVGSGTDALRFALMAVGVRAGDIVITAPNTFIATTEAISQAGARPVFLDVDESTYNMNVELLREYLEYGCEWNNAIGALIDRKLGRPVSAIVPVHLYGQMADMDAILEAADRFKLIVIEDACQAHGAEYFSKRYGCWKKAGSMGAAAAFSFYPGKNLGACGEAGAVTTNNGTVATKVRMLRDHGQAKKYYHDVEGYNGRLDAIQAGILQSKLRHLTTWNKKRQELARHYRELLGSTNDVVLPGEPSWSRPVYHLYVIRAKEREHLRHDLNQVGIGTGIHYPVPLHLQNAYMTLGYRAGDFPIAERYATEIVSLPMFPNLTAEQQQRVAAAIHMSVEGRSAPDLEGAVAGAGD